MVLFQAPILTDGATHSAQQFRMLVRDLSRGAEGVTNGTDLKVTALSTPGAGVQIGDGSGIVIGKDAAFQGSYAVCNVGAATLGIAPGGASSRWDLVALRILDPEYAGSADPAVDPIMFFDVFPDVGPTATDIPPGYTAIPLARVQIPPSTSTITAGLITDLRKVANPRRERAMYVESPATPSGEISGSSGTYSYFSTAAGWNIDVPSWASKAIIRCDVGGLRYSTANFNGYFGATLGSSLTVQQTILDDNGGTGVRRSTALAADTLTIPDSYRGTTQLLRMRAAGGSGNTGKVSVDTSSTLVAEVEFVDAPR
ncbi:MULTISPECIES: hypothetical protein [unclassified Streptomyces]|uniref:hypothetical protein n=1 Tax=unclassified Streptomyces TaxID=2593676 RepID=UPI0033C43EAE